MDTPDIKIGETYYTPAKVIGIGQNGNPLVCVLNHDIHCFPDELHPITPSEPQAEACPDPKYDPSRLFRKGDKVRVVEWNGRNYTDRDHNTELHTGCFAEIWEDEKDEQEEGYVSVIYQEYIRCVPPCYLELVTPVEEMGPYSVRHSEAHAAYSIYGPYGLSAVNYFYGDRYPYSKHSAEAAAYAECDRLNAAHRKDQK